MLAVIWINKVMRYNGDNLIRLLRRNRMQGEVLPAKRAGRPSADRR